MGDRGRVDDTAGEPVFNTLIDELGIHLDAELFELATTHRSYAYENGGIPHNERLEFLGDAVLGVIVTDFLYRTFPGHSEGQLAKLRANVVSAVSLAKVGRELGVGQLIRLGKGEIATQGWEKDSILADTMEALIGAIYMSCGRIEAERYVHHLFDPLVMYADTLGAGLDWKTSLQETAAAMGLGSVHYEIIDSGPDHRKVFDAWAVIADRRYGPCRGHNKKHAEQQAAELAFKALDAEQRASRPSPETTDA
ncbi:ribonuclease III [Propionibacterium sp. oral taxon 192 str. F0372]|uniref:ribonuclease III n=1 Tax=Propionibacterium sp. oral taxon 192 TaxID=671222 RepID=UPI00035464EF|nr:ribonuclease III [Propionibacterium sp. oral taxon 192]EPH00259.1 ribonuclease III [Propionibacterium sp. oral taxon 192 str. F0372]